MLDTEREVADMIFRRRALTGDQMSSLLSNLVNSIREHVDGLDRSLMNDMRDGFRNSCNWDMIRNKPANGMGAPDINVVQR
eukprot:COSAG04_NODE_9830_length_829_cov_0.608219_1_plen_81_part_00